MTTGGLSKARLARMHDVMATHVERGAVPGIVTLLSRGREVHVDAIGTKSVGGSDPIRRDTIFRISSMTKPIAAAATLILVEEGKLRLDEPVDRLLPELADRKVLRRLDAPLEETVPAKRPILVRDLLTFSMGFGLIMAPGDHPIMDAANALQLGMGPPKPQTPHVPDEWLRRFATLPLMAQPGETWMYQTAFCVLGVLIARAAGEPLEVALRERIFSPLGMTDTGFSVPPDKLDRLGPGYRSGAEPGTLELLDGVHGSQWSRPPAFPNAEGGLVSTVDDYLAFSRMLLNRGRHGGERLLAPASVEAMTTNQLAPRQRATARAFLGDDRGWGFGLSTAAAPGPGRYGWDGGLGTSWASDPDDGLVAILMTQRLPPNFEVYDDFWTSVSEVTGH